MYADFHRALVLEKLVYLVRVTHCVNVKFLQTMLE